jgi:CRP/FNR family cyclic AMP-dependent transcriptional regulator
MNRSMTSAAPPRRPDPSRLAKELRDLGTFPGADTAELRRIAAAGDLVSVPQGWSLIWERTAADKAYVVLEGAVDIRKGDRVVARLGAGDVIGELAIVRRELRSATVVAGSPLRVLHFTRGAVEELYAGSPAFRSGLDRAAGEHRP